MHNLKTLKRHTPHKNDIAIDVAECIVNDGGYSRVVIVADDPEAFLVELGAAWEKLKLRHKRQRNMIEDLTMKAQLASKLDLMENKTFTAEPPYRTITGRHNYCNSRSATKLSSDLSGLIRDTRS